MRNSRELGQQVSGTDAWNIEAGAFPTGGGPAAQLAFAARYATLAPSSHNSQPWRFVIHADRLDLHADRTRALPIVDPHDRELAISCGAALFFLRLALRHFGRATTVELVPSVVGNDVLASVWLGGACVPTDDEERLFSALLARHTNRGPFATLEVDEETRMSLVAAAAEEGAWLELASPIIKEQLAALISEGDRRQLADPHFRRELASWLRSNDESDDGMPGYVRGLGDLEAEAEPLVVRTFDVGGGRAARDHALAVGAPLLAVIGTDGDDEGDWVRAGGALARVLLRATTARLAASFLNQPIELPDLRGRLSALLGRTGYPQLVIRLGHPTVAQQPTPRRGPAAVIRISE